MEGMMPHRQVERAEELRRRRLLPKPVRKPPPEAETAPPTLGVEKSILGANPRDVSQERERSRKITRFKEQGIESFWFGEQ